MGLGYLGGAKEQGKTKPALLELGGASEGRQCPLEAMSALENEAG